MNDKKYDSNISSIRSTCSSQRIDLKPMSTHTIHAHAHISRMLRHNYMVVLIQIEHTFFEGQRKTVSTKWKRRLVSDGCTSGLSPVRQCSCRAYQQLAPTQLIRRMGAGLVIVYGLGLILPLPFTVGYLYPLVSSMSSHTSKDIGARAPVCVLGVDPSMEVSPL